MLVRIIRKEVTELIRDHRLRIFAAGIVVLTAVALCVGLVHHKNVQAFRQESQLLTRQQWEKQPARNPHGAAHYGIYAIKDSPVLSFIENGISDFSGYAMYLEAHYQNPMRYRSAEDATAISRMGNFTAGAMLQYYFPLFIILMAYPCFASERENGTLRQLLAHGVSRHKLFWGKAIAILGIQAVLCLPIIAISLVSIWYLSGSESEPILRFLLMISGLMVYYVATALLTLSVSAIVKRSATALAIMLGFWFITTFVAPVVTTAIAEQLHPVPSAEDFALGINEDKLKGLDGHRAGSDSYRAFVDSVLQHYNVKRTEDLPVNIYGLAFQKGEDYSNTVMDAHYDDLTSIYEDQARVRRSVAAFVPFIAVRSWLMGLAGTDFWHHAHFHRFAEDYRRTFVKILNDDLAYYEGHLTTKDREYQFATDPHFSTLYAKMPHFQYIRPELSEVFTVNQSYFAILIFWCLGLLACCFASAKGLKP